MQFNGINLEYPNDIKTNELRYSQNTKNRLGYNEFQDYFIEWKNKGVKYDERTYYSMHTSDKDKQAMYSLSYTYNDDLYRNGIPSPKIKVFVDTEKEETSNNRLASFYVFADAKIGAKSILNDEKIGFDKLISSSLIESVNGIVNESILYKDVNIAVSYSNDYGESGLTTIKIPDGIYHYFVLVSFADLKNKLKESIYNRPSFNINGIKYLNFYVKYGQLSDYILVKKANIENLFSYYKWNSGNFGSTKWQDLEGLDAKITTLNDYSVTMRSLFDSSSKLGEGFNKEVAIFYSGLFGYQDITQTKSQKWFLPNKLLSFSPLHNVSNQEAFLSDTQHIEKYGDAEENSDIDIIGFAPFANSIYSYGMKRDEGTFLYDWTHTESVYKFKNISALTSIKNNNISLNDYSSCGNDTDVLLSRVSSNSGYGIAKKMKDLPTSAISSFNGGYSIYNCEVYIQYVKQDVNGDYIVSNTQTINTLQHPATYIKTFFDNILVDYQNYKDDVIASTPQGDTPYYGYKINFFIKFYKNGEDDIYYRVLTIDLDDILVNEVNYNSITKDKFELANFLNGKDGTSRVIGGGRLAKNVLIPIRSIYVVKNNDNTKKSLGIGFLLDYIYRARDILKNDGELLTNEINAITDIKEIIYDVSGLFSDVYKKYKSGVSSYLIPASEVKEPDERYITRHIEMFDNRIFYSLKYNNGEYNKLYYTLQKYPEITIPTNYFILENKITAIQSLKNTLYVFTTKEIYVVSNVLNRKIDGILEPEYHLEKVFFEGAYEWTVKTFEDTIFFTNNTGIYTINSNGIKLVSRNINRLFIDYSLFNNKTIMDIDNVDYAEIKEKFYIIRLKNNIDFRKLTGISNLSRIKYTKGDELLEYSPIMFDYNSNFIAFDITNGTFWFGNEVENKRQLLITKTFDNLFRSYNNFFLAKLKRIALSFDNSVISENNDDTVFCTQLKNSTKSIYGFSFGKYYKQLLFDKYDNYDNDTINITRNTYNGNYMHRPIRHTVKGYRFFDISLLFDFGKDVKVRDFNFISGRKIK